MTPRNLSAETTLLGTMNEIQSTIIKPASIEEIAPILARDLAQDLYTPDELIERHGLNQAMLRRLLRSKSFRAMVTAAKGEWAAPGNAKNRAQLKAQLAVEEAIPDLYTIIVDKEEAATARVSAFSQLREVGKFEKAPAEQAGSGGPGFSVTINLGDNTLKVSAAPHTNVAEIEATSEEVDDVQTT